MTTPLITSGTPLTQRGMATLTTALILLIAITLMTFSSARVGIVEHQIAANNYRAKQALQAAQAGLDRAVYESNVTGVGAANSTLPLTFNAVTALTAVGTGPSTSYQYAYYLPPGVPPCVLPSCVTPSLIQITARGFSDDGVATKTLTQYVKLYSPLPRIPNPPVTSGGLYDSNSSAINIVNNITSTAIQAQGTIDTHDKNVTSVNGVAGAGLVPNATTPGVIGVVDTTAERDAFFNSIFGTTKTDIQSISLPVTCNGSCNTQLSNTGTTLSGNTITNYGTPQSSFIWVTGNTTLNSNTVIGSPTNPVVLVVNGTLLINGGATIYGFIYVTGNVQDNVGGVAATLSGQAKVSGSLASEEDLKFSGTVDITYNQFKNGGGPSGPDFYVKAPGTWTD